MDVHVGRRS